MPTVPLIEYKDATPEAKAVFDAIKAARNVEDVNNFWKALANHPDSLRRTWDNLRAVMQPGALDPLTKEMLYIAVPVTLLAYLFADRFTLAGMGEEFAVNLGLHYKQIVNTGLAIVALTTSVVVLTVGAIPFLGLIVPNVVTMIMGDNIKKSLPYTALLGALFVLACDIIGRTIRYPYEIPIGTIVGVLGSGMFLFLIMRRGAYATG